MLVGQARILTPLQTIHSAEGASVGLQRLHHLCTVAVPSMTPTYERIYSRGIAMPPRRRSTGRASGRPSMRNSRTREGLPASDPIQIISTTAFHTDAIKVDHLTSHPRVSKTRLPLRVGRYHLCPEQITTIVTTTSTHEIPL